MVMFIDRRNESINLYNPTDMFLSLSADIQLSSEQHVFDIFPVKWLMDR